LYATHIVDTKAALLNMTRALDLEKAPDQIIIQEGQGPSSRATGVSTQKLGASQHDAVTSDLDAAYATEGMKLKPGVSQDEAITSNPDASHATSNMQSSKEALPSPPTISSATVFPFFRLPPELRDEIYTYASTTQKVWIGRPPRLDHTPDDVIVEKNSTYKPTTLIRTRHSIVSVSHETRDEFRTAMWREYMTTTRKVRFRVYDFSLSPLKELFTSCSASEVKKLQKRNKCRVQHHLTASFHEYRRENRLWELIQLFTAWLKFNVHTLWHAKQSIDKCDWYDTQLLRTTLEDERKWGDAEWDSHWNCPFMIEFWDVVSAAHERCNAARNARRNAFHKLAPLGQ
jgi:hypothetical protein